MTELTESTELRVPRGAGFRSYEVYQRMRLTQTTPLIRPRQLSSDQYLTDPQSLVAILREHYPCYRDWPGNCFWVTRYDDVTSVFVDDANYETRSKLWRYDRVGWGADLGATVEVRTSITKHADRLAEEIVRALISGLRDGETRDLAVEVCAAFPAVLLARTLGLPEHDHLDFFVRHLTMQRGVGFEPVARQAGLDAMDALRAYFTPLVEARRGGDGEDLVSTVARLGGSAEDLVVTLLEADHETLHGALANLWSLLLTHRDQLDVARRQPRAMKYAYLESMRHSPPVVSADRFARHEVERFGRLLPEGALLRCSSAAANRDPRVFAEPDEFVVGRPDLCQREPRGTYRADGLASGISFGTGAPSKHPAVPEDRPRSAYALARDLAVTASSVLLDELPGLRLQEGVVPLRRSRRLGEMHTCWSLPVTW